MKTSLLHKKLEKAQGFCHENKLNEAKEIYLEIIKVAPNLPEALNNLALIEFQNERFESGILFLEKSIKANPNQLAAHINIGKAFVDTGNPAKAIEHFDLAIKLNSNVPEIYYNRGRALRQLSQYDKALESYTQAINLDPSSYFAFNNRAIVFNILGRHIEALSDINNAIKLNPKCLDAYLLRAITNENLESYDEAIQNYDTVIRLFPSAYDAYNSRGVLLSKKGRIEDAIQDYEKAIQLNPHLPDPYNNKAVIYIGMEKYNLALEEVNKAIAIIPDYPEAYNTRGAIYNKLEKYENAINDFTSAVKIKQDFKVAYCNLGIALHAIRRDIEAIQNFNIALRLDSDYIDALISRAACFHAVREYEKAIDDYNKAEVLDPKNPEIFANRAATLVELKKFKDALNDCEIAIALRPNYGIAYNNRASVYSNIGDYEKSIRNYEKAIQFKKNFPEACMNAAMDYLKTKDFVNGWQHYEKRFETQQYNNKIINNINLLKKQRLTNFDCENKKILLVAEHGLGDEILYLSLLKEFYNAITLKYNKLIVMVDPRLIEWCDRSFDSIDFISSKTPVEKIDFDLFFPIGSIGNFFRNDEKSFSRQAIGYLKPDQIKSKGLKKCFDNASKFVCGISWKSSNKNIGQDKSLTLVDFLPLLRIRNIEFVNLQYGDTADEIFNLEKNYNIIIKNISEIDNTEDIDGLASLINACDFVVTSSNVTAHIAGSIGKETYVIVPFARGKIWYWHINESKSLWYPKVHQMQQVKNSDWEIPVTEIANKIREKFNE
jgi:tetratricopeptide (TPR) repeat protein